MQDVRQFAPGSIETLLASVSALLDPEKLAGLTVDHVRALLDVDGAALYWWDAREETLTALADNDPRIAPPVPVINPGQGIAGAAFADNTALATKDGVTDEGPAWMHEMHIAASLAVPVRVEDRPRGVLVARSYTPRAFTEKEAELVLAVADHVAPALATMGLLARAQRERNVAHALAELMRAAARCGSTDALLGLVVHYATRLLGADDGEVVLHKREGAPGDGEASSSPYRTVGGGTIMKVPIADARRGFGTLVLRWNDEAHVTEAQERIAVTLAEFAATALERSGADEKMRRDRALLRTVIRSAPVAFIAVDRELRVTFREGVDLVRLGLDGIGVGDVLPEREDAVGEVRESARRALGGVEVVEAISSDRVALELRFAPVRDGEGTIVGATGVAIDLSERRGLEAKLAFRATHDALTELPNRELFLDRLEQAIHAAARTGDPLAVVLLDVEDFGDVNAALGPRTADHALRQLAARLASATEFPGATLARVDGDRFGWILPGARERETLSVLHRILTAADEPISVAAQTFAVRVTLGVVLHHGPDAEAAELTRRADAALQGARAERTPFAVFDPAIDREPDGLAVVTELRDALAREALVLRYHPVVDLETGRIAAAEALVRWMHPERGILSPDAFIPVAERVGLIGRVTAQVLEHALADLARWRREGLSCSVSVNLSAWDVADPSFPARFVALTQRHGVSPSDVQFEITESAVMTDRPSTLDVLARLTETGATVALDDFGTGYSSLAYLRRLPVTAIKIDRSFVREMHSSPESRIIVGSLVHLARDLGLHVVAEGVEFERDLAMLRVLGCPSAQGHLFAPPLPVDDLIVRLRANAAMCDGGDARATETGTAAS